MLQGRFIREDPIGLRAGINLYSYVKNDPTRFRDPMGENPVVIVAGVALVEALVHRYFSSRAESFFPNSKFLSLYRFWASLRVFR